MTAHAPADPMFEALLDYVKRTRGFDFMGYKRATLQRRVLKRVHDLKLRSFGDYMDYLEVHPEEFPILFDTILINVTSFFRDPPAWEYLAGEVIPRLLDRRRDGDPIRAWSAGCASGEEVYTLAILLADAMGPEAFKKGVKIYATDMDEDALSQARAASYSEKNLDRVPEELRKRYFEQVGDRHVFSPDLRRCIIFGRHDLLEDAPISKLDLLVCRNALIYFNAEAQSRIIARFHFGLKEQGYLFLGKAEMLLTQSNLFVPLDLKARVFEKVSRRSLKDRLAIMTQADGQDLEGVGLEQQFHLRDAAFEAAAAPTLVVDGDGYLVQANNSARSIFGLADRDVGRPLKDLEASYRPADLRSPMDQALAERTTIVVPSVEWVRGETSLSFDLVFTPLYTSEGGPLGVVISFRDVTGMRRLEGQLEKQKQDLETAYEELQSSNEELETTNEELQSTVEELETTNEELQASNEELETLYEELQSTNEELQGTNDQLRMRSTDLGSLNTFLNTIIGSVGMGLAVVDSTGRIDVWNETAEEMWGARPDEVLGRTFDQIDIGIAVETLASMVRDSLRGQKNKALTLDAVNRRGHRIRVKVSCFVLGDQASEGAVVLMEQLPD